jgi:hypothetical protein
LLPETTFNYNQLDRTQQRDKPFSGAETPCKLAVAQQSEAMRRRLT